MTEQADVIQLIKDDIREEIRKAIAIKELYKKETGCDERYFEQVQYIVGLVTAGGIIQRHTNCQQRSCKDGN